MMKFDCPLSIGVTVMNEMQIRGVYAVLSSGAALAAALAVADGGSAGNISAPVGGDAKPATSKPSATAETQASDAPASVGTGETATTDASPSDSIEVDAQGWPWSEDMHASTKGKTKEGLWRMKVGVSRPDPKPGFPKPDGTGTSSDTAAGASTDTASVPATVDAEEDEFAAFTKANQEAETAAAVPARTWADADLSALCAQAATKLGDADPVRAIIASYVPEGETPHSRNVPADQREAFAAEIEAKAGITYAG